MPFGVEIESRSDSRSEFSSRKPNSEKKIKPTHLVTSRRPCPTFVWVGCCTHQASVIGYGSEEYLISQFFWWQLVSWLVKIIGLMYELKAKISTGPYLKTNMMFPLHCDSLSDPWCFDKWVQDKLARNFDWQLWCCQIATNNNFFCDLSWCVQFPISH